MGPHDSYHHRTDKRAKLRFSLTQTRRLQRGSSEEHSREGPVKETPIEGQVKKTPVRVKQRRLQRGSSEEESSEDQVKKTPERVK
jgi:hypothetical protein